MRHAGDRWLVGLAGVQVVGVGLMMIVDGARRRFENELNLDDTAADPALRSCDWA